MPALIFFVLSIIFTLSHLYISKQWNPKKIVEVFLANLIFFNIGFMGILSFYAHTHMSEDIAKAIGWPPGSPFQYEVAMADLAFGMLGLLSMWFRGLFWCATVLGSSIFLLGDFFVHMNEYLLGDYAPYNIGVFVWLGDLIIPLLTLSLLIYYIYSRKISNPV
jgi:hypothetical protein